MKMRALSGVSSSSRRHQPLAGAPKPSRLMMSEVRDMTCPRMREAVRDSSERCSVLSEEHCQATTERVNATSNVPTKMLQRLFMDLKTYADKGMMLRFLL